MTSKITEPKLLTETELELMNILWRISEGSVHDVMQGLASGRDLAYTSVSTILRILEQKKFIQSRKEGRGHIYIPRVSKEQYEGTSLQHLVQKVFNGTPSAMVRRLLETADLTEEELRSIRALFTHSTSQVEPNQLETNKLEIDQSEKKPAGSTS